MKKVILSSFLIFGFGAYILHIRILGTTAPVILTPEPNKPKVALSLPEYNLITTEPKPSNNTTQNTTPTQISNPVIIKPKPVIVPPPVINTGKYKNGNYTGDSIDASYGYVQVKVIVSGGKIADVQFLSYPDSRSTSVRINSRAMPYLISEAIYTQDSNVDAVSGASFTSAAFNESLSSALSQART